MPSGKVWLIKSIRVTNDGSVGTIRGGVDGTAVEDRFLWTTVAAGSTYVDPDTDPVVLAAGEDLRFQGAVASGTLGMTVTIGGAELTA